MIGRTHRSLARSDECGEMSVGKGLAIIGILSIPTIATILACNNYFANTIQIQQAAGHVKTAGVAYDPIEAKSQLIQAKADIVGRSGDPSWWGQNPETNFDTIRANIDSQIGSLDTVIESDAARGSQEFANMYDPLQDAIKRSADNLDRAADWVNMPTKIGTVVGVIGYVIGGLASVAIGHF